MCVVVYTDFENSGGKARVFIHGHALRELMMTLNHDSERILHLCAPSSVSYYYVQFKITKSTT